MRRFEVGNATGWIVDCWFWILDLFWILDFRNSKKFLGKSPKVRIPCRTTALASTLRYKMSHSLQIQSRSGIRTFNLFNLEIDNLSTSSDSGDHPETGVLEFCGLLPHPTLPSSSENISPSWRWKIQDTWLQRRLQRRLQRKGSIEGYIIHDAKSTWTFANRFHYPYSMEVLSTETRVLPPPHNAPSQSSRGPDSDRPWIVFVWGWKVL